MKVWEMMNRTELFGEYTAKDDGIVCLCCGQIANENEIGVTGEWTEKFPHKSSCFLIQDIDTAKGNTIFQNGLLLRIALKSLWKQIVDICKETIREIKS